MKHIAKLRKKNSYWQLVGSQAVQEIVQRIEKAYQLFFKFHKRGVRPPSFKKRRKYKSFTLKQAGYKLLGTEYELAKKLIDFGRVGKSRARSKLSPSKETLWGNYF